MTEEPIRIGIIGAGKNTRDRHVPGLLAQSGVEIVAVANRSLESSRKAAEALGPQVRPAADWTEVLDMDDVDAVCIGTWPYMHAPITIDALDAGKHVLCEARMAMDSLEAKEMLAASRRNPSLVAQIVPAPHTLAFDRTIIEMIAAGDVGEVIALDARVAAGSDFPDGSAPVHWRQDRDLSGNNVMAMGIWYEAMMRWVGPAASVFAVGQSVVRHRLDDNGRRVPMTIPDHLDIVGRLETGGQMRFNITSVVGHAPLQADVFIFGTDGTLRLTLDKAGKMKLEAGRRGGSGLAEVQVDPAKRGGWRVEEEFINAIRGTEPVTHTDFVTGVKYMEWTDAVAQSLRHGVAVKLPLVEAKGG
ncbi:MAG: Gfo/Idh/MocA family protein [Alphaproteobacteria bacterium]